MKNKFLRYIILKLVRMKLGLKLNEPFRFSNQKNKKEYYYFEKYTLMKCKVLRKVDEKRYVDDKGITYEYSGKYKEMLKFVESNVTLNFLLSDECIIERIDRIHD